MRCFWKGALPTAACRVCTADAIHIHFVVTDTGFAGGEATDSQPCLKAFEDGTLTIPEDPNDVIAARERAVAALAGVPAVGVWGLAKGVGIGDVMALGILVLVGTTVFFVVAAGIDAAESPQS